jgi:hypothetical protein
MYENCQELDEGPYAHTQHDTFLFGDSVQDCSQYVPKGQPVTRDRAGDISETLSFLSTRVFSEVSNTDQLLLPN